VEELDLRRDDELVRDAEDDCGASRRYCAITSSCGRRPVPGIAPRPCIAPTASESASQRSSNGSWASAAARVRRATACAAPNC